MCGIVGVAGGIDEARGASIVGAMSATLVHRGPDDEGSWAGDGVAFAMRRLSIIDLAGGHQPMWTGDGVGIVFNGEIYNYRKLREELIGSGYRFRTHSDTEVILNLYHRDGLAAIDRLEGVRDLPLRYRSRAAPRADRSARAAYSARCQRVISPDKAIRAGRAPARARRQALQHYLRCATCRDGTIWKGITSSTRPILTLDVAAERIA